MVYESDFYTTRRPYRASPSLSTYTITTPRYYTVRDSPDTSRRSAEEQYSYSYTSEAKNSSDPYSRPMNRSYSTSERVSRSSDAGPGRYTYSTESTSRSRGDGPGGYHSSYSSTTSGRLPGGTSYRHYSYRSEPSRQVRILPGLGKVHVVHSYDRIVPYVGHKRLTVVTSPPVVIRCRPSTLYREFDRIEHKLRPITYNSYTNDYLNSNSSVRIVYVRNPISSSYSIYRPSTLYSTRYYPTYASYNYYPSYLYDYNYPYYPIAPTTRYYSTYRYYPSYRWQDLALYPSWRYNHFARIFDDERRAIKAETSALLHRIHDPVPRKLRSLPLPYVSRYDYEMMPARLSNDNYIHRMILSTPSNKSEYTTYYTDPVRKYFGQGHLACVTLCGEKNHPRRRNVYVYQDPVKNDIHLLSYYINRFRDEKALKAKPAKVKLDPFRPTRIFSSPKLLEEEKESEEMKELKAQRAARLTLVSSYKEESVQKSSEKVSIVKESKSKPKERKEDAAVKQKEEERARLKKEKEEEQERSRIKKEKEAEQARLKAEEEEAKKQALLEAQRKSQEEAEKKEKEAREAAEKAAELKRLAEQARLEELAKEEEIRQAKLAEEERQRQEEERRLLEAAKEEEERQQLLRLEEIARQAEEEKEAELARQAEELAELARQEALIAEQNRIEEERLEEERKREEEEALHKKEAELEELVQKEQETVILAQQEEEIAEAARSAAETAKTEAEELNLEVQESVVEQEGVVEQENVAESESIAEPETTAEAENVESSNPDEPIGSADDFVFASED